jgi:Ca-activated chloride channel family protein
MTSTHPYREEPGFSFGELEASGASLPVRRIDIHARVSGVHAHVSLEQHYVNDRDAALEVIYIFPLPALGAVSSYTFTVDGVATRGTLRERDEARAIYDQAIAEGKSASTLEEDRPEVMTVRVGNLAPGSRASVRIGLDLVLPIADDCAVLRLPLLVGARYVPGEALGGAPSGDGTALDTHDVPDASRVTPPLAVDDPGTRVGVLIEAFDAKDVLATHPLDIDRRADRLQIRIADVVPDGDVVLQFPLTARDSALFVPDPTGDRGTLVVTSCSVLPPSTPPLDVVVLLDRSGSMDGDKIALARRAAAAIVEGLTPRDRVMVIAFDHDIEAPLGNELVPATASQRRRACEQLERVEARGGTELAQPLQLATHAFRLATDPGGGPGEGLIEKLLHRRPQRRRAIVLVTDGQVANEDQLVGIAARGHVDILAVAIGAAANQGLCQRLATTTGGGYEAAASEALLAGALDRTLRRLLAPALDELEIAIDGARFAPRSRAPGKPPRAIPGVPATIAARVISTTGAWTDASRPRTVELHAVDPQGNAVRRTLPIEVVDLPSLRRVWARLRIRDLEDQIAATAFPACLQLEDELVATSLEHGVLCRYTAFVAVDKRVIDRRRPRERVVQPVIAKQRELSSGRATKTQAGTVRGKMSHLSPEQCRGLPIHATSDVFSLGVIIHELASLARLFRGESDFDTLKKIIDCEVPPLPPAYAALDSILGRALAKKPADRFRDAGEFAAALAALPATRDGLAELAMKHARRRAVSGPIAARSRALWVTECISRGHLHTTYAAVYAGPLDGAFPDAIVRVGHIDRYSDGELQDPLAIDHPNVARVLGVLAVAERVHVIEWVPGIDLLALMRALHEAKTPLSLGQVVAVAQDLAAGLAAIHARGTIAREVAPFGCVLSTSGRAVLVDLPSAIPGTPLPVLPLPLRGLGKFLR